MATLVAAAPLPDRRTWTRGVFFALAGIDVLGALAMIVFTSGITIGEVLFIAAAAAIGVAAALAFARAVETSSAATRTVWIARAFGLVGAAISVWFPAILFGELRYATPGTLTPNDVVLGEIRFSLLTLPLALIPIGIALRMPVAGGVLFLLQAAYNLVQTVFDPSGSFPERTVNAMSIAFSVGPALLIGLALLIGGLAMRRAPREVSLRDWLRALVG